MLRLILATPFIIVLVAFALSNTDPVRLGLWPTDLSVEMPLSIAILGFSAVFFFLGALITWLPGLKTRNRANRAEKRLAVHEARIKAAATPTPITRNLLAGPQ